MPTIPQPLFTELPAEDLLKLDLLAEPEKILEALGFYREYGIPPGGFSDHIKREAAEILSDLSGCLFRALQEATKPRPSEIASTLAAIERDPERHKDAHSEVLWYLASFFRRGDEAYARHWPDILGGAPAGHPGGPTAKPSPENIRRAATAALNALDKPKVRQKLAQHRIADEIGRIYLQFNKNFGRVLEKDGGKWVERSHFTVFLDLLLVELNKFLRPQGIRLTSTTIARLASDRWNVEPETEVESKAILSDLP